MMNKTLLHKFILKIGIPFFVLVVLIFMLGKIRKNNIQTIPIPESVQEKVTTIIATSTIPSKK